MMCSQIDSCSGNVPQPLADFFHEQLQWSRDQVSQHKGDVYWQNVGLILAQLDGLLAGYNAVAPKDQQLTEWAFSLLNGVGDMFDIKPTGKERRRKRRREGGKCFVLRCCFWGESCDCVPGL